MPALKNTYVNYGGPNSTASGAGFPSAGQGTGIYGGIPIVPNPTQTATQAIQGNLGNLGALYGLGTGLSGITAAEAKGQFESNLPGFDAMTSKASANIGEDLAGQLPADVVALLQQQAAERGVATGSPDSPNSNAAYLRALGLTSLSRKDLGQQELTAAINRTPTGPLFDPSRMLVTPEQQQAAAAAQNLYNSAPNPMLAAQEAQRLAHLGLGSGAGTVGAAPGLRSPMFTNPFSSGGGVNDSTGGPPASRGTSSDLSGLGLTPEQEKSLMEFWNQDWNVLTPDPTGLNAPPSQDWTNLESEYWNNLGPDQGAQTNNPIPGTYEDIQQYLDNSMFGGGE